MKQYIIRPFIAVFFWIIVSTQSFASAQENWTPPSEGDVGFIDNIGIYNRFIWNEIGGWLTEDCTSYEHETIILDVDYIEGITEIWRSNLPFSYQDVGNDPDNWLNPSRDEYWNVAIGSSNTHAYYQNNKQACETNWNPRKCPLRTGYRYFVSVTLIPNPNPPPESIWSLFNQNGQVGENRDCLDDVNLHNVSCAGYVCNKAIRF